MRHLTTFRLIDIVAKKKSIRSAADAAAITPSALLRRIQTFEDELGTPIFERLSDGVRLNAAGELVVDHIRKQLADTEKLNTKIGDLSGVRLGHVSVACSPALTFDFLPREIAQYVKQYPDVTFDIQVLDHTAAERALMDYSVDLAFVFERSHNPDFQVLIAVQQQLSVLLAADHPLAGKDHLRLIEYMDFPWALPSKIFGGRALIDAALMRISRKPDIMLQSNSFEFLKNYVLQNHAVTFQSPIAMNADLPGDGLIMNPLDPQDLKPSLIFFGQRAGRTLPVASARFADQIAKSLSDRYPLM